MTRDLKQLAADAARIEASAKAWLSECEGLDRTEAAALAALSAALIAEARGWVIEGTK